MSNLDLLAPGRLNSRERFLVVTAPDYVHLIRILKFTSLEVNQTMEATLSYSIEYIDFSSSRILNQNASTQQSIQTSPLRVIDQRRYKLIMLNGVFRQHAL